MEKEFVTYEQALALKELGFDERCLGLYYNDDKIAKINMVAQNKQQLGIINGTYLDICDERQIPVALYSQAFRWFREKYMLLHEIVFYRENKRTKKGYWYVIDKWNKEFTKREIIGTTVYFETYEEAESACLDRLIEIVKTQQS